MKQRVITGSILVLVLGLITYFGEGPLRFLFTGLCLVLSGVAAWEFGKVTFSDKLNSYIRYLPIVFSVGFTLLNLLVFEATWIWFLYSMIYLLGVFLVYILLYVFISNLSYKDIANSFLTIIYTSLGFIAFGILRHLSIYLIIYLFLVSMLTDVFAYLIGIKFGKHRLAVKISPKKSVEGAVAGLLIGGLLAGLFAYFANFFNNMNIVLVILLTFVLSAISQIGDLVASKFKREVGIKDYSQIFPGHGGVLDRFDSSMFLAVFLLIIIMVI
jgi:phosphatidate cytidylyltransferase